jgi:hypothetical protein
MPLPAFVTNERTVEIPWLLSRLGRPRRLLDVGHADADYAPELLATGAAVTLQDVRPFSPRHIHGPAQYAAHIGGPPWPEGWRFDRITCISVIDHVGLDAYGQPADDAALPALLAAIATALAPRGRLLLTTPVGRDLWTTHPGGGQRVFSKKSLDALLKGWNEVSCDLSRLIDGIYRPVAGWAEVKDAGYLTYRAEAVACLELTR